MAKTTKKNVAEEIQLLLDNKEFGEAADLIRKFKVSDFTVTKTTALKMGLKPQQLDNLVFIEAKNPHYSSGAPMKLYLKAQLQSLVENR